MFVEDFEHKCELVKQLIREPSGGRLGNLDHIATEIFAKQDRLLALIQQHQTPFYLFDHEAFLGALNRFRRSLNAHVPRHSPFYAVKSNHHGMVVGTAVEAEYGLDVSSGRELHQALEAKATRILFSGPAKSISDLTTAIENADRVTINIDSFGELRRIAQLTQSLNRSIRAGVRISTKHHGNWSKFGIPLTELRAFWHEAQNYPGVRLEGIQSHLSWTFDGSPYCRVIADVAKYLRDQFSSEELARIKYFDFGGGYRPYQIEGIYPTETTLGEVLSIAAGHFGEEVCFKDRYYVQDSAPIEVYAQAIGHAIHEHLNPLSPMAEYYSEPGRIVSAYALHLVLRVMDKKRDDLVIVDGGIHMVGWERYLHVYAPIMNLTRPAMQELPMRVYGSLCDPEDLFGRACYASAVEEGDVLIMPNQGAYSFATAQSFIRPIPPMHRL